MKNKILTEPYVAPEMEVQVIYAEGFICQSDSSSFNGDGLDDFSRENPDWFN